MENSLKPCPFCGGEWDGARINHDDECFIVMDERNYFDYEEGRTPRYNREQLYEAWNTRAERTCTVKQTGYATGICSNCGGEFNASVCTNVPPDYVESARYCPNCGARVEVSE